MSGLNGCADSAPGDLGQARWQRQAARAKHLWVRMGVLRWEGLRQWPDLQFLTARSSAAWLLLWGVWSHIL